MQELTRPETNNRPPHSAWKFVRGLVPILLLTAVLWTTDWNDMVSQARSADPLLLAGAVVLYQLAVLVQGWRWHVLAASDNSHWPRGRMQLINYISTFFDGFTPGKLGSDAFRLASFRNTGRIHHLVMSLLALRLHGMAASFVVAAVAGGVVLSIKHGWLKTGLPWLGGLVLLMIVSAKFYQVIRKGTVAVKYGRKGLLQSAAVQLSRAHDAVVSMFTSRRTLHRSNALVLLYTLLIVATYYCTGLAFKMTLPFQNYLAVVPLLVLASVAPITIQGRGLVEVIALGCWQGARASQEQILLTCFTVFAIMIVQGLMGGAVWVVSRSRIRRS